MSISGGILSQQDQDRIANAVPGVSSIQIFRERIEARNAIEYIIYFRVEDGTKKVRADLWVDDATAVLARGDVEEYIKGLAVNAIRDKVEEIS